MVARSTGDRETSTVEWQRTSPDGIREPVVRTVPYLELKLEHPGLDPSSHTERFFPDAVPYEVDGTPRIFYWYPAIPSSATEPETWILACATTHELVGVDALPGDGPSLVTQGGSSTILVVEGTIAGETLTSRVHSYDPPSVSLEEVTGDGIDLWFDGTAYHVSSGERRRIRLEEQSVLPVTDGEDTTTVEPELVVRFPGRRELHHPAPGARHRLFPSFGLELEDLPERLSVPTSADELDDDALAAALDVDLSRRPYPERVLWQAFAYTAFDPHRDCAPQLAQLDTGHIVLLTGPGSRD
jgi:hypothetical protein